MKFPFLFLLLMTTTCCSYSQEIKIISPQKGDIWEIGKTHVIRWQTSGISKDAMVAIYLKYQFGAKGYRNVKIAFSKNTGSTRQTTDNMQRQI